MRDGQSFLLCDWYCVFSESSCAYVLIVTAVYWVSEAVPLGAAALVPAFLYPLFGVLKSSEVASEYFKDTTLLLMGVICLAASIEKWNLHKRIALRMVMIAGAKPGMLVLGFMCCTVFLSMWLSNTSTTAMVMPIAEAVLQQLICTGIADSLEDSLTVDTQDEESGQSEHPSQNIPAPPRKPKIRRDSLYPTNRDHMICKCLSLSITYAATIGGLITITGTSTNLIFAEQFNNRYPEAKVINFGTWFIFSLPIALIMLMLTWIWLHFLFLGCNFRETCSLSKKRKTRREILSEKRIHEEYQKLGPISYPEVVTGIFFVLMTVLWFTREPGFVHGWTLLFEKKGYRTDATVSVLLGFLLFLIPDPLAPMITWKDFQRLMPWEIVILVGGGYALAAGCKVSIQIRPIIRNIMIFETPNSHWPISETLHINPLHTLIPATMCVSFGVMLPVGNPPNAIVFSYGHVQISDMVKAGFGVNLIGVFVVMLAIMTWGEPLFHLSEFPTWALMPNVTGSL
uniref:Solute carrier family 13 member 4-like n=1 Tax=Sinocyclocheilus anshuiensis TaxID=1608454 RepID=A0A671T390_9TELE